MIHDTGERRSVNLEVDEPHEDGIYDTGFVMKGGEWVFWCVTWLGKEGGWVFDGTR